MLSNIEDEELKSKLENASLETEMKSDYIGGHRMRMEIDVNKLSKENRLGPINWNLDQSNVAKHEEIMDYF